MIAGSFVLLHDSLVVELIWLACLGTDFSSLAHNVEVSVQLSRSLQLGLASFGALEPVSPLLRGIESVKVSSDWLGESGGLRNVLAFVSGCLPLHQVELDAAHATLLELQIKVLLLTLLVFIGQPIGAALDVLEHIVIEIELVGEVAVSTFKHLDTLVFEADQAQVHALEVEHEQIVNKVRDRRNLSFALVSCLTSQCDSLQGLLSNQFGLLLVKEPLGGVEVHLVLCQNVPQDALSLYGLQKV